MLKIHTHCELTLIIMTHNRYNLHDFEFMLPNNVILSSFAHHIWNAVKRRYSCAEDIIEPAKNNRDVLHWRKNIVQMVISLRTQSKIERSNMSLEVISNMVGPDIVISKS